ncbi:RimJ/RimL family protein N-acetyltransferase [Hydrogenophaga palleronii]|uniref:RimJ/RimL family protein N-acetyltransferase n=1 Tax=Hydrogenophaga palleronii TaxID=65655 RepID=A0ABU1WN75_9BURK|nr:GNAT family N-acetyltransferase [Hydrogenophaga palleronii]MDR7150732.1 RimJ/RimL family protein N-acetyltransferase [Hydrogenophaga palleronii]
MVNPLHWFKPGAPSVEALTGAAGAPPEPAKQKTAVVPIRSIGPAQVDRVVEHLLALEPHDRYLRFGYAASDEHIRRYVDQINFDRDELFGIFNRKLDLIALAHLAFSVDPQYNSCAEFGVSVAKAARGRGFGGRLFERAVMHARNEGVMMLFIHALTENTAMLKIARNAGAVIERDGSESEAHLVLPPADFDSRVTEMVNQHMAFTDYHLKAQAKQFWGLLSRLQNRREGEQAKVE